MDQPPEPSVAARERSADIHGELDEASATLLDAAPLAILRRVEGRETVVCSVDCLARVPREAGAQGPVIVKRARAGGWSSALRRRRCAAEKEHENLVALARAGLPVPEALGWQQRGPRSAVAMERVAHAQTLRERLATADARERRALLGTLVVIVARMHAAGWCHRDLYLQHFVLAERGLVLLDVGRALRVEDDWRAAFGASALERWFVKDVAALLHSTPRSVSAREQLRFAVRYFDRRGIDGRVARRAFLARVLAKERRMAAHPPRAGEDRPWTDR